jgi:serine/threonine protein kinase/dipeptidyl aminopeptidase/acylaminoacyl peptidase
MSIPAGTRLGPYEIGSLIGVGGMGEVYRAKDTRLGRDVAIKVLPESFAADRERRARFEREAQAVAALSHPNIVAVFDTGAHDNQVFVVMELLTGQTLRARLANGALPVKKAVDIAVQIARGLGAAHGKGIIHRDLKPENVFLLEDGQVKILDFGLARKFGANDGNDATRTIGTDPGTVMGTLGYMAPEQLRGQPTDARADVFSFGAVLYEMVSGHRAFQRDTAADTTTAILTHEPPEMAAARADVPPSLERIVRHCLEKNAAERFQNARDIAFALEALSGTGVNVPTNAVPVVAQQAARSRGLWPVIAAVALVAGGLLGMFVERSRTPERAEIRFTPRTWENEWITNARFTPDGQSIIYSSATTGSVPSLYVMRPGEVTPQELGGAGTHLLSVSSTGELAVLTDATNLWGHRVFSGTLSRMSATGGARAWMDHVTEADWSPDGSTLALVRENAGVWQLEYPMGKVLHTVKVGYLSDPRVSPDGEHVAFFEHQLSGDDRGNVKVVDKSGNVKVLTGDYWGEETISWSNDSQTVYYAAAGDGGQSSYQVYGVNIAGTPKPRQVLGGPIPLCVFDIARDGRMLVVQDNYRSSIRAMLPGAASEREFPWLDFPLSPFLSDDGKHMAFTDLSQSAGPDYAVAWRDTAGGPVVRLGKGFGVALSPDNKWVLSAVPSTGAYVLYPTGAGDAITIPGLVNVDISLAAHWSSDSRHLIACGTAAGKAPRCYRVSIEKPTLNEPITPENVVGLLSASDDTTFLARVADGTWRRVISATELGAPVPGMTNLDSPVAWSSDRRSIISSKRLDVPMPIERIDVVTGARTLLRTAAPPDSAGINRTALSHWDDRNHSYAYSYTKELTQLFTVTGVIR